MNSALDVLPIPVLKAALGAYTARRMYQASLVAGADRIGLDGLPAGTVTENQARDAAERLQALNQRNADVATQASQAFKASQNSAVTAAPEAPRRLSLADLKAAARVRRTA